MGRAFAFGARRGAFDWRGNIFVIGWNLDGRFLGVAGRAAAFGSGRCITGRWRILSCMLPAVLTSRVEGYTSLPQVAELRVRGELLAGVVVDGLHGAGGGGGRRGTARCDAVQQRAHS